MHLRDLASNLIEKMRESRCRVPPGRAERPLRALGAPDRSHTVREAQGIGLIHFLELGTHQPQEVSLKSDQETETLRHD
jgi:hypothetical protein